MVYRKLIIRNMNLPFMDVLDHNSNHKYNYKVKIELNFKYKSILDQWIYYHDCKISLMFIYENNLIQYIHPVFNIFPNKWEIKKVGNPLSKLIVYFCYGTLWNSIYSTNYILEYIKENKETIPKNAYIELQKYLIKKI